MKRFYLLGFLVLLIFDTLAQVSFKLAGDHALPLDLSMAWLDRLFGYPWIYGAFVGYIGSFFTWMTILKHAPIGPAFAASHLELVSVIFVSIIFLGEPFHWTQGVGALLIIGGICCLAVSETREEGPSSVDGSVPKAS